MLSMKMIQNKILLDIVLQPVIAMKPYILEMCMASEFLVFFLQLLVAVVCLITSSSLVFMMK